MSHYRPVAWTSQSLRAPYTLAPMPRPERLSDRVTRLEVMFEDLGRQIGRELEVASSVHQSLDTAVNKLTAIVAAQEQRIGKTELRLAWITGAGAVLIFLSQVFAPTIRALLGVTP